MIGNANDKDLLKRLYYQQQAAQPVTLTQTQQNNSKVGVPLEKTMGRSDYGGSHWDQMYFTDDELLNSYNTRNAAQNGDITWDDAHKYVENIRNKYGYSGGKHGDEYNLLSQPVRTDSWENTVSDVMQNMANYDQLLSSDPYQPGLDAAYQAIRDRKPFEYDLEADPAWQAYRKQYTREGRRASEDTLGQYAAMTGGMPSTAAMTAAQQAGDYYAAQMTDKIPELYRLAYSMYADDANRQLADLNAIRGLSGDWYGRQMDAYGRLGDLYSMASGERSYADTRNDKAAADAYQYAMATGDYSYLRDLGYDTSYLEKQRDKDMAALDKPELSLAEVNAAIKAGNTAPNVLKAWEYYYGEPYEGPTGGYGGGGGGYTLKGDDVALPPVGSKIDLSTDVGKKVAAIPGAIGDYLSRWDDMDAETRYIALVTSGVDTSDALRISGSGDRWQAQMALENAAGTGEEAGDMYSQLFAAGATTEDEAKRLLQQNGMTYTEANDAAKTYMGLYGNGTFGNTVGGDTMMTAISGISSEKDAVNMLEDNGIMAKPLTREQWALDSGNSIFKTYTDYLKAFVYEYMNGG